MLNGDIREPYTPMLSLSCSLYNTKTEEIHRSIAIFIWCSSSESKHLNRKFSSHVQKPKDRERLHLLHNLRVSCKNPYPKRIMYPDQCRKWRWYHRKSYRIRKLILLKPQDHKCTRCFVISMHDKSQMNLVRLSNRQLRYRIHSSSATHIRCDDTPLHSIHAGIQYTHDPGWWHRPIERGRERENSRALAK